MGEVIFITSGKGGVGKTTVTANLGKELARSDKKVILLDYDFGLRNLDIMMGIEHAVVYHFADVLTGRCRLRQAILHPWMEESLYFLPAADQADFVPDQIAYQAFMTELKRSYDYILIDSPAGVSPMFDMTLPYMDRMFLVVTSDTASLSDAAYLLRRIPAGNHVSAYLVLNRFPRWVCGFHKLPDSRDLQDFFRIPVLVTIYEDRKARDCTNFGQFICQESASAGRAFITLKDHILHL